MEEVLHVSRGLQRFDRAAAPVFVFGSFLGILAVTDKRVLFLSTGGTGYLSTASGTVAAGPMSTEVASQIDARLKVTGSLAIDRDRVVFASPQRRWDFGRYLRIEYLTVQGEGKATSLIPRGVASSGWIEYVVAAIEG